VKKLGVIAFLVLTIAQIPSESVGMKRSSGDPLELQKSKSKRQRIYPQQAAVAVLQNPEQALNQAYLSGASASPQRTAEAQIPVDMEVQNPSADLASQAVHGEQSHLVAMEVDQGQAVVVPVAESVKREGWTLLHAAAHSGDAALLGELLALNPDVNESDIFGYTALHWAASEGYDYCVSMLLEKQADATAVDVWKRTALHLALRNGHLGCARILVTQYKQMGIEFPADSYDGNET